jgi:hypothetical protein
LFYHFVRFTVVLALISGVIVLGIGTFFSTDGVCLPNGDFALYNDTYNPWALSGFLSDYHGLWYFAILECEDYGHCVGRCE